MSKQKPAAATKKSTSAVADGAIPQTTLRIPMPKGGKPVPSSTSSKPTT